MKGGRDRQGQPCLPLLASPCWLPPTSPGTCVGGPAAEPGSSFPLPESSISPQGRCGSPAEAEAVKSPARPPTPAGTAGPQAHPVAVTLPRPADGSLGLGLCSRMRCWQTAPAWFPEGLKAAHPAGSQEGRGRGWRGPWQEGCARGTCASSSVTTSTQKAFVQD